MGRSGQAVHHARNARCKIDDTKDEGRLRARVDDLVKAAAGADGPVRRGVGAGWLVELRPGRGKGSALVAESHVVHVAML